MRNVSATHPNMPRDSKMPKKIHFAKDDSNKTLCKLLVLNEIDPDSAIAHTTDYCGNCKNISDKN